MFFLTLVLRKNMSKLLFLLDSLKQMVFLNLFTVIFREDIGLYPTYGKKNSHYSWWLSRVVSIFFIKYKSDVSQCLINFHKFFTVQYGKQIKRFRCDNSGEFTSNSKMIFYEKMRFFRNHLPSYPPPQQNGVMEMKHIHLFETTQALRFEANILKRFGEECILTVAYIINCLPSKVIKDKSPNMST